MAAAAGSAAKALASKEMSSSIEQHFKGLKFDLGEKTISGISKSDMDNKLNPKQAIDVLSKKFDAVSPTRNPGLHIDLVQSCANGFKEMAKDLLKIAPKLGADKENMAVAPKLPGKGLDNKITEDDKKALVDIAAGVLNGQDQNQNPSKRPSPGRP